MGKENTILTVDIGSRSMKLAEFFFQDGVILLTKFLSRRIELAEGETQGEWFDRNYLDMLVEGGFTAKSVRLALPASNSFLRLSKLPAMLGSSSTVSRIIEFEASQAVPYAMHEVEWGYQLLHHEWDETVEETDEDGNTQEVTVTNEEYEALFVAVKNEDVACFTDVIERAGQKLLSVELAALNIFNAAVVSQVNEDECTMILEIGGKGSCLMLADHRRIFMRNIPIGGDTINTQIAREFSVSDQEAEDLKRRYGFVALGGAYDEPESAFAATISKIARNVMTRLHGEISRSINVWRAQHNGNPPVKVLLAGGGSTMQYTTEFFNEKLHLPVEYLNTFGLITIGDTIDRNALQAQASMSQGMIGMALHDIGNCPVDISLLPRDIRKQHELDARKPYFYASAIALISCLLISVAGISQVLGFEMERVSRVEADVQRAKTELNSVMSLKGQLDSLKGTYEHSTKFWNARNQFARLLMILQEQIPDRMWLVAMEPVVENAADDSFSDEFTSAPADDKGGSNPNRKITPEQFNSITELKRIRLGGYIMNLEADGDSNLLHIFTENIRKIPTPGVTPAEGENAELLFEDVRITQELVDGSNNNLTYFEVVLTLREAMKK